MSARRPFLAGNWKMHLTASQAADLALGLRERVGGETDRDVAVFPPFTALAPVIEALKGSPILVGAQTCHFEAKGAYTGEVSPEMIADLGCRLVLVGHSERRQLFGETDEIVRVKLEAALRAGLEPILCLGETLDEREADRTEEVVRRQAVAAFEGVPGADLESVTVAYEPVWAIGTGQVATPEQAQAVHQFIRQRLAQLDGEIAQQVQILYGGSMNPANASQLLSQPDIDGGLIGGASLKADDFLAIAQAA